MCGAAACALSASMRAHFSTKTKVSPPNFVWKLRPSASMVEAVLDAAVLGVHEARWPERVQIWARVPGLAVMMAMT